MNLEEIDSAEDVEAWMIESHLFDGMTDGEIKQLAKAVYNLAVAGGINSGI